MIIRILLIGGLALAALMLMRGGGSALGLLMRRSMAVLSILVGIAAVLFPGAVTQVANAVGVGRGTDLVLYVLCVAFLFVTISLTLRLSALQDRTVELARKIALLEAEMHERDREQSL